MPPYLDSLEREVFEPPKRRQQILTKCEALAARQKAKKEFDEQLQFYEAVQQQAEENIKIIHQGGKK